MEQKLINMVVIIFHMKIALQNFGLLGILNVEDVDYDNIYQYDPLGLSTSICLDEEQTLYGANVFKKDNTSVEALKEISISSVVEQGFELYINPLDGELSKEKLQKVEIDETTIRSGYTTIKLKTPIELSGEEFAVAVKYTGNNRKAYIGIENPNKSYWATATSNKGESYYSLDGETWIDLKDTGIENSNICIKAFTNIKWYNIISDSYKVEEELIYRVSPKTTLEAFKENIKTSGSIKILKSNIELQEGEIITTGTTIKVDNNRSYQVIVSGDITGTGTITTTDISKLKLHLVGKVLLNETEEKAADINYTGDVTLTDLSQMKSTVIGLIN